MRTFSRNTPTNYTLRPAGNSGHNYLIFEDAPFYLDSLNVTVTATASSYTGFDIGVATPMQLGVDYFPILLFSQASAQMQQSIYGGICFVDKNLDGVAEVSYEPLGYGYHITPQQITQLYGSSEFDPLISLWETTVTAQPPFPNIHPYISSENQSTFEQVNAEISSIATTLSGLSAANSIYSFIDHLGDIHNPHFTIAKDVGLELVPNWLVAQRSDIIGKVPFKFVTPKAIADSITDIVPEATDLTAGKIVFNSGVAANSATDAVSVLTASSFTILENNNVVTDLVAQINNQQQTLQFSPFPIVYPATYAGTVCNTFSQLVDRVSQISGIKNLGSCAKTGKVYFPNNVAPISLALS